MGSGASGPGHNIAVYHRNPDDQMVEFFTDLDRMYDEESGYFEPKPWHKDRPQKPKTWDPNKQRDMWGLPPGPTGGAATSSAVKALFCAADLGARHHVPPFHDILLNLRGDNVWRTWLGIDTL